MNRFKSHVLITIDTEFSIGGYFHDKKNKPVPADRIIYCRIAGKEYGINLIMDILEKYDLKGVFFVETESRFYFGEETIIQIIRHIKSRGHEIQLHTHPNFRSFKNEERMPDDMREYSFEQQFHIIKNAIEFLGNHGISGISAHRSGGFYSNLNTLLAQRENGLTFSSNYNIAYPNCNYIAKYSGHNDIFSVEQMYEIPITCYKEAKIRKEWNSFQLSAASFQELKNALYYYHSVKTNVITAITHSFEFVKPYDFQYSRAKPLRLLIDRFDKLCRFLSDNKDKFVVITFNNLLATLSNVENRPSEKQDTYYHSPLVDTLSRYFINLVSKYYPL